MNLSEGDLDAIEQRAAQATPGPWWSWIEGRDGLSGASFIGRGHGSERELDLYLSTGATQPVPTADYDFIAQARQDVPRLVAEIRRLRALGPT